MSNRKQTFFFGVMVAVISLVVGMVIASRLGMSPVSFAGSLDVPKTNSAPLTGAMDASTFREIARVASPTVVSIRTTAVRQSTSIEEFFGMQLPPSRNQRPRQRPEPEMAMSAGSGFIIDKAGFILTNNHVVEDATKIEVKLAGMDEAGHWLDAKVVGADLLTDTALLQLTESPDEAVTASQFGDSAQLQAGDWVMAIGNPFSLSNTVTVGVVSAVGRSQQGPVSGRFEQMIQTDAAINRGNSGGPLLNIRGEVVGINTQIVSDGGGNLGIGFAVPINTVRDILPQLMKGKVVRGRIGVSVNRALITKADAEDLGLSNTAGAIVSEVTNGPAQKAGLRVGDVILEFNGKPVKNSDELVSMVTHTAPGTTVPVRIVRNKKSQTVNVTVEELNLESERSEALVPGENTPDETKDTAFGITLEGLNAQMARRLNLPPGTTGVIVTDVEPSGAAALAGLRAGDIITDINDQKVTTVEQAGKALDGVANGRTARMVVVRNGRDVLIMVRKR